MALNQIETSSRQDRDGQTYWLFEHSAQVCSLIFDNEHDLQWPGIGLHMIIPS